MKKESFNSNHYREMYAKMGINLDKLGCIMLDVDNDGNKVIGPIPKEFGDDVLYTTKNPDRFWIKGFVAGETPHVTLLYGLIHPICIKNDVVTVLHGWQCDQVKIDHVGFFDSPYADDPYYCIIAHVNIDDNLLEGHQRLSLLPHINTYPEYKAHITIAYIKKDEMLRDKVLAHYNSHIEQLPALKVKSINYGKQQSSYSPEK